MRPQALRQTLTIAEAETEQSVIGLLMDGPEVAWKVLDLCPLDDLVEPLHKRTIEAARRILEAGNAPNPLTLAAAMAGDKALDELGGGDYFIHIRTRFGRNADIAQELCAALADHAQRRWLRFELAETEAMLADMSRPARDILAEHQGAIQEIAEGKPQADDPVGLYESAAQVIDRLDTPALQRPLIPYGVAGLDDSIGGMSAGDVIIAAARPGMGKTALALAIADYNVARGFSVFFSSLEMRKHQLSERWLSMRAFEKHDKIPYSLIRQNKLQDFQKDILARVHNEAGHLPLIIDDRRGLTLSQIGVRIRSAAAKMRREGHPLALAVIDHLHLIRPDGAYRGNKVAETTEISAGIKTLAGQLDIPILCLCQLSRAVEQRDDKRPQLSDLRESGAIEQDADVVLLLHRPEYYARKNRPDASDGKAIAEWEMKLTNSKGFVNIAVPKVRQGEEDDIRAKCEIAYNWIGERMA